MADNLSSYDRIYKIVSLIPFGQVATYGQIALLAGMPRHARQVGYALNKLNDSTDLPWHRVINSKGEVSPRAWCDNHLIQRILLEEENVSFDQHGRISLATFGWKPK